MLSFSYSVDKPGAYFHALHSFPFISTFSPHTIQYVLHWNKNCSISCIYILFTKPVFFKKSNRILHSLQSSANSISCNFKLLLSTFQPSHVISSLCELYFQHLNQKSFLITVFSNLVFYLFIYLLLLIYTVHYIPYPYLYYTYYILY